MFGKHLLKAASVGTEQASVLRCMEAAESELRTLTTRQFMYIIRQSKYISVILPSNVVQGPHKQLCGHADDMQGNETAKSLTWSMFPRTQQMLMLLTIQTEYILK